MLARRNGLKGRVGKAESQRVHILSGLTTQVQAGAAGERLLLCVMRRAGIDFFFFLPPVSIEHAECKLLESTYADLGGSS